MVMPPKPTEQKRLLGNPGKRAIAPLGKVAVLPAAIGTPEPPRPLGAAGSELWERIWDRAIHWISPTTDIELALMTCESVDERAALRFRVLAMNDPEERRLLRSLDAQIIQSLSLLGFTPTDRTRLGVAEVRAQSAIESIINKRRTNAKA